MQRFEATLFTGTYAKMPTCKHNKITRYEAVEYIIASDCLEALCEHYSASIRIHRALRELY
jgi:hypothetical protein